MWDLHSLTRDWTRSPCTGRRSLNHWTATEVFVLVSCVYAHFLFQCERQNLFSKFYFTIAKTWRQCKCPILKNPFGTCLFLVCLVPFASIYFLFTTTSSAPYPAHVISPINIHWKSECIKLWCVHRVEECVVDRALSAALAKRLRWTDSWKKNQVT